MRWHLSVLFAITVLFDVRQLEGKLALEHSPKSSEMLSNAIYSSKNNEITETEQLNGEKMAKEVEANEIEIEEEPATTLLAQHESDAVNLNDNVDDEGDDGNGEQNKLLEYQENVKGKVKVEKKIEMKIKKIPQQQQQLIRKNENGKFVNKKTTKIATTKSSVGSSLKLQQQQRPNSFINPFGQLSAFLGGDQLHQLQDYNFLFNAERHTIFQLHTAALQKGDGNGRIGGSSSNTLSSGRVLNVVVGNSLSAAFGVNPTSATGGPPSKVEEVQLYDAASLRQSRFNPFNPTRILIHGWFGGSHAGVYNTLVPEYLKLGNGSYNIFTVDWGRGAIADYITASYRVKPVGKVIAKFIDFLHRESGMRFEDLHVIGFSMGAHIAGIAGKHVQTGRLPIIYALDPALPLFRFEHIDERIALTDADYVEVIHTSVGSYGYDRPLGHVDFYVNYGSGQPGCFFNECSHFRAFQVLAESLYRPTAFRGQGCDVKWWLDLIKNRRCLMGTGRNLTLGGDPTDVLATRKRGGGVYYFTTNASPPYAKS